MKTNDVPATLQAAVREVLADENQPILAATLDITRRSVAHNTSADSGRPVTWEFIGRLAYWMPYTWGRIERTQENAERLAEARDEGLPTPKDVQP